MLDTKVKNLIRVSDMTKTILKAVTQARRKAQRSAQELAMAISSLGYNLNMVASELEPLTAAAPRSHTRTVTSDQSAG